MTAEAHLLSGDLDATLKALQDDVRGDAANPKLRIFLFQLLCVTGDWKRAITQLRLCAQMDDLSVPMAQTYREGIICEVYREKIFAGEKTPLIFGEPSEWMALMVEALKAQVAGQSDEAASIRARAFEAAPEISGEINGEPFEWIADADMRLGPLFEVVINGRYFWMPFDAIATVTCEPPADLRDAVWMPAMMTLKNDGEVAALIPTRYSDTAQNGSDAEKLARATSWNNVGNETYLGMGQRLLTSDLGDHAIMDLRTLKMNSQNG